MVDPLLLQGLLFWKESPKHGRDAHATWHGRLAREHSRPYRPLLPVADRRYSFQAAWKLLRSPIPIHFTAVNSVRCSQTTDPFLPRITRISRMKTQPALDRSQFPSLPPVTRIDPLFQLSAFQVSAFLFLSAASA